MMRKTMSMPMFVANPAPRALTRNSTAAICMTRSRPKRSAIRPADMAPAAAPSSAEATAKPSVVDSTLNTSPMALTAPLMTALS